MGKLMMIMKKTRYSHKRIGLIEFNMTFYTPKSLIYDDDYRFLVALSEQKYLLNNNNNLILMMMMMSLWTNNRHHQRKRK